MRLREGLTDESFQNEVEHFNKRSNPWLYGLSSYVGENFLKKRSDLITSE